MTRFERWSVWTTSLLVLGTGLGLAWAKYLVTAPDPLAVSHHPLEPWFLKLHILAAPLLLVSFGFIALRHVWNHLTSGQGRARRSGLITALVFGPMVLSGYLLQVATSLAWIRAIAVTHLVVGGLYGVGLGLHQLVLHWPRNRKMTVREGGAGPGTRTARRRPGGALGDATEAPFASLSALERLRSEAQRAERAIER